MGNNTEFERAVIWLSENLTFNINARINLFEVSNMISSCAEIGLSWITFVLVFHYVIDDI